MDYQIYQVVEELLVTILNLQILVHMVVSIKIANQDNFKVAEWVLIKDISMAELEDKVAVVIHITTFIKKTVRELKAVLAHLVQVSRDVILVHHVGLNSNYLRYLIRWPWVE